MGLLTLLLNAKRTGFEDLNLNARLWIEAGFERPAKVWQARIIPDPMTRVARLGIFSRNAGFWKHVLGPKIGFWEFPKTPGFRKYIGIFWDFVQIRQKLCSFVVFCYFRHLWGILVPFTAFKLYCFWLDWLDIWQDLKITIILTRSLFLTEFGSTMYLENFKFFKKYDYLNRNRCRLPYCLE